MGVESTNATTHAFPSGSVTFRLYEQQSEDDEDHDTKYDLTREILTELEEEVGVPADTSSSTRGFGPQLCSDLLRNIESYGKDWVGPLRSNRRATCAGDQIRVDAERVISPIFTERRTWSRPVRKRVEFKLARRRSVS